MSFMAVVAQIIRAVGELPPDQRDRAIRLLAEATTAAGTSAEETAEDRRKRLDRERKARKVSAETDRNSGSTSAEFPVVSPEFPRNSGLARASDSSIISLESPSLTKPASLQADAREHEDEHVSEPANEPVTQAVREQWYRAAYERGITKGKGSTYAMPIAQTAELHQAIQAHQRDGAGKARRGADLLANIEWDAQQFAEWVKGRPITEAKFWSHDPRAWLRWLNKASEAGQAAPTASALGRRV